MYDSRGRYIEQDDLPIVEPPFYCQECGMRLPNNPNAGDITITRQTATPFIDENGDDLWIEGDTFADYVPPYWVCEYCGTGWCDPFDLTEKP